jgi:diguanylate cyclase (GGDEF)-like protein/PAS domain S-box-containing protein
MQAPDNTSAAAKETAAIRTEQMRLLYTETPAAIAANVGIAAILAMMQWRVLDASPVIGWLAFMALVLVARALLLFAHRRAAHSGADFDVWLQRFRVSVAATGVGWGLASFLLFPANDVPHQAFLAFALAGITAGAVILLSIDLVAALAFTVPALVPLIVRLFSEGDELSQAMGMMVTLFLAFIGMSARRTYRGFRETMRLRFEAVRREQVLSRSEERLSQAQQVAHVGSFDWSPVSGELQWSDEHFRLWGMQPQSVTPSYELFRQGIHPDDVAQMEAILQAALQGGSGYGFTHRVLWPDGSEHHIYARGEVTFDQAGVAVRLAGTVQEVTEQKLAEEALRRSETKFRTLYDTTGDAVMLLDEKGFFDCNTAALMTFGCATRAQFCSRHPADLSPPAQPCGTDSLTLASRHIATAMEMGRHHFEWVHQRADTGETFPADVLLSALELDGKAILQAVVRDITRRKKAEAELRIAAIVFESQEGMAVTDANNVILKVNLAFTLITGYSAEEAVGRTPDILKSDRQDAKFYQAMWERLGRDRFWQGEIWNKRKDGEVFPGWLSITAVTDDEGQATHYIATFTDITQQKQAEDTIHNLAFYDPLTTLPNRRLLQDRLQHTLASSVRNQRHGAILFIDLDNFKQLNDSKGHDIGDLLLVEVAQRLQSCVRSADTVARQGGDEFVIMLDELSTESEQAAVQAETIAEKIRSAVNQPFMLQGYEYHGSPSIGISLFRGHENTVDELLKRADNAMYQAKRSGRNAIRFFDPATHAAMEARIALETDLRRAVPENQLRLYYQMQVDHTGHIIGAEVLLRWQHPERGLVPPLQFIPLAEESGLILPIGHWVLQTACVKLKAWESDPSARHLQLAVNVSARQFRQADFVEQVCAVLHATAIDPARLKLELTESLVLDNVSDTIVKMQALKDIGVHFSMDDFGTGYSSLAYLSQLPLDQVKIDQSFVRNIGVKSTDAVIVQTIIGMANNLGLNVIAEGVETLEQRDFLERNGCPNYQGYLFGRPVPVGEFESSLLKVKPELEGLAQVG